MGLITGNLEVFKNETLRLLKNNPNYQENIMLRNELNCNTIDL
jgi:hypothetical protein